MRNSPLNLLAAAIGCTFATIAAHAATNYVVSDLPAFGGTRNQGNSINDRGWIGGFTTRAGDLHHHATIWVGGVPNDLGTLGGPNSNIAWPVKNNAGLVVGISQTATPEVLGENWSCSIFFLPADPTGYICRGFAWRAGQMRMLPTLGGPNGYAAGANNRGEIVGWAETTFRDPSCEGAGPGLSGQQLQFLPVVYGPDAAAIRALPLLAGDSSGAATAINDRGQAVGISGTCDQAVGRYTAAHAVLWDSDGTVTDIGAGALTAAYWNTPVAISEHGDVAGFAGEPGDPDANVTHAFLWTRAGGVQRLNPGSDDNSTATGINAQGQVVGYFVAADGSLHGFIWDAANGMRDLNDLKQSGYGEVIALADDINDAGVITGRTASNPATAVRSAIVMVPVDTD